MSSDLAALSLPGEEFGERVKWRPERPRLRPASPALTWVVAAVAVFVAAAIVPRVAIDDLWGALGVAVVIAVLNAIAPPFVAALRLPYMLLVGFGLVLLIDAAMLYGASELTADAISVDSFGWAIVAALVISAVMIVLVHGDRAAALGAGGLLAMVTNSVLSFPFERGGRLAEGRDRSRLLSRC